MFDIGGPEFLVIAVVALVVLGPERLPEVMRRAGVFYRQARQMLDQYTGEAQRMFEEGMREVNDVSNTISNTWQDATTESTPALPPPALFQVPPPLQAPEHAAAAGPWALPAGYRDTRADLEPRIAEYPASPFALPAALAEEDLFDDVNAGGPTLMGPAPTLDGAGWPIETEPPPLPPVPPANGRVGAPEETAEPVSPLASRVTPPERRRLAADGPEPALAAVDEGALFAAEEQPAAAPAAPGNGKLRRPGDDMKDAEMVRQETVIELYRTGDITLDKAAEFLGITPGQFRGLLKRK